MARRYVLAGSLLTAALVCIPTFTVSLFAQQDRSKSRSSGREAYESATARNRNLQNREMVMQHAGDEYKKGLSDELKNLISRMREDFKRLQIVNNSMMAAVAGQKVLEYKNIGEATDEINKCAKRLQVFLPMADGDDDKNDENKQNSLDPKQMRSALFNLDDLVMGFVTSPLFKNLVDTESVDKAKRDLSGIIELSEVIKKNAEKLSKAP
jgi:hypothetical protein